MGGFSVIADKNKLTEKTCTDSYGAHWLYGYCFRIFRDHGDNEQPCEGTNGQQADKGTGILCKWTAANDEVYDVMQRHGVNVTEYYDQAYDCARREKHDVEMEMQVAEGLPPCWYNPGAWPAKFTSNGPYGGLSQHITWGDFNDE